MSEQAKATIDSTLSALRQRLRWLYFLYGMSVMFIYCAFAVAGSYFLDRTLNLPRELRIMILLSVGLGFAYLFVRKVIFPLHKKIHDTDLALAIERRFPELREKLVSAVELIKPDRNTSVVMVEKVRQEAAANLQVLPISQTVTAKPSLRMFCFGVVLCFSIFTFFLANPQNAVIWLQRFFAQEVAWPQETFLNIHISSQEGNLHITEDAANIKVQIVKGSDLPIRVTAIGKVPDTVTLHFNYGKSWNMTRTGEQEFTHRIQAIRKDFSFYATGGDDLDQNPRVEIIPVAPPELSELEVKITPPAYTGLEPKTQTGGAVEALVGSQIAVHVTSSKPITKGQIRFQQTDKTFPLAAQEDPLRLTANFLLETSDRYAIELFDENELHNPDTGSYSVTAIPDRGPEIRTFSPSKTDLDACPQGNIPIRAFFEDDFGVVQAKLFLRVGNQETSKEVELPLFYLGATANQPPDAVARRKGFADSSFEISALRVGDRPPFEGEILYLKLQATDNKVPEANSKETTEFRIVLISSEELERRLHEALNRIRESVEELESLQSEKLKQVEDLLMVIDEEGSLPESERSAVQHTFIGQRRAASSSQTVATQLTDIFETALYNRLEREADAWMQKLEQLRQEARAQNIDEQNQEFMNQINVRAISQLHQAYKNGQVGASGLLSKLLEMSTLAISIAQGSSSAAVNALESVLHTLDAEKQKGLIQEAYVQQKNAIQSIDTLLGLLAEWDNYQTVLNLTRELLERQRTINTRTKQMTQK